VGIDTVPIAGVYTSYRPCNAHVSDSDFAKRDIDRTELSMNTSPYSISRETQISKSLVELSEWPKELRGWREMVADAVRVAFPTAAQSCGGHSSPERNRLLNDTNVEFKHVATMIGELQVRVNQILDRGTSEMQLIAARQSLAESHDLARLTWLATVFIPMTFVTGLFSKNNNIGPLVDSFKTYFAVAIPLVVVALVAARLSGYLTQIVSKVAEYLSFCLDCLRYILSLRHMILLCSSPEYRARSYLNCKALFWG
jgi:Mg2+ and Co2+ transporter CorA